MKVKNEKTKRYGFVMLVYLLGIFIGAIDTGILTPARTVVQNSFGVDERTGIWMITAFTLAYACAMPILGKLADRIGRKRVYMVAVAFFGAGSLICGLSNFAGSFPMLIAGRVIQALGGGGIMPLATAEFGTGFPEEKRGMALGLVGGVYGIANILGATLGSAILDLVGTANWHWLFFINLPICVFVVAAAIVALPKNEKQPAQKIDLKGTFVLVLLVLSLMYSLNNIDFFNFGETIGDLNVYPFLIAFVVLIPLFLWIEKRAVDPIFNTGYFKSKNIVIVFFLAFIVGVMLMGMVFVPQFAENALKTPEGSGGYFVTILGLFAGIGGPMGGKLVDKFGPKKILFFGFGVSLISALFLALYATVHVSTVAVIVSLVLMGTGLGFVMGTPLNYMMLSNTKPEESNSALSALSLMRSIGTTIGPMLMIGFIAQAGISAQDSIMNVIPPVSSIQIQADDTLTGNIRDDLKAVEVNLGLMDGLKTQLLAKTDELETDNTALQQATDKTNADLEVLKNEPRFKKMLDEMDFEMPENMESPDFSEIREMLNKDSGMTAADIEDKLSMLDFKQQDMNIDMNGDGELPDDVVQKISSSSVTTIVDNTVYLVDRVFGIYTPDVIADIQDGIGQGIDGIQSGIDGIGEAIDGIGDGIDGMTSAEDGITAGTDGISKGIDGMDTGVKEMNKAVKGIKSGIAGIQKGKADLQKGLDGVTAGITGMQQGIVGLDAQIAAKQQELQQQIDAGAPAYVIGPLQGQLAGLNAARKNLADQLSTAQAQQQQMQGAIAKMDDQISSMNAATRKLKNSKGDLVTLIDDMEQQKALMETMKQHVGETKTLMEQLKDLLTQTQANMQSANEGLAELKDSIPGLFDAAKKSYIEAVKAKGPEIEATFQSTLNAGFQQMYYTVSVFAVVAAVALIFYKQQKKKKADSAQGLSAEQN